MCFTIEVHLTRKAIEKRFSVDTSALFDFDFIDNIQKGFNQKKKDQWRQKQLSELQEWLGLEPTIHVSDKNPGKIEHRQE